MVWFHSPGESEGEAEPGEKGRVQGFIEAREAQKPGPPGSQNFGGHNEAREEPSPRIGSGSRRRRRGSGCGSSRTEGCTSRIRPRLLHLRRRLLLRPGHRRLPAHQRPRPRGLPLFRAVHPGQRLDQLPCPRSLERRSPYRHGLRSAAHLHPLRDHPQLRHRLRRREEHSAQTRSSSRASSSSAASPPVA